MISLVLKGLKDASGLSGPSDDDIIDRLNHVWTVGLLVFFAIVVSSAQFVGEPIQCWTPAQFTGAYNAYTKQICWISNTYYVPMDDEIPRSIDTRQDAEITYYQWMPLILLFMAFLFKIPNIMWRMANGLSGVNIGKIVDLSASIVLESPGKREETIQHLSRYLDRWLESTRVYNWNSFTQVRRKFSGLMCFCVGKRYGTYLTGLYLFMKLLFFGNVVGQFFLLNAFMSTSYNLFGFEVIAYLNEGGEWRESSRFPRVTLCDFEIRTLGNIQRHTVQCVLPVNLFNEKIFIFIWFWLVLVASFTAFSYVLWMYQLIFKHNRVAYIKKYLKLINELHSGFDKKLARKFADEYLRDDGIFVLRVITKNSSDIVLTDLISCLWKNFKENSPTKNNIIANDYDSDPEMVKDVV